MNVCTCFTTFAVPFCCCSQAPMLGPATFRPQGWGRGGSGAASSLQDSAKTDKDKRPARYERERGGGTVTISTAYVCTCTCTCVSSSSAELAQALPSVLLTKTSSQSVVAQARVPNEVIPRLLLTANQRRLWPFRPSNKPRPS